MRTSCHYQIFILRWITIRVFTVRRQPFLDFQVQAKAAPFAASDPVCFQLWKFTRLLSKAFDVRKVGYIRVCIHFFESVAFFVRQFGSY
jgi:hypothetical protein